MVFGGGSKTYKTWAMCDLALSIVSGANWWKFQCAPFPVLYVNFELKRYYARERFEAIRLAKNIAPEHVDETLSIWNLRDYNVSRDLCGFRTQALEFIGANGIGVVFLDPFYKLLGDADERVSAEMMPVINMFEQMSLESEISTVTAAHFTKGNQAAKDPLDRISGGAVINRHPDSLMTLTKHESEGSFTIDTITRDFAVIDPFVVKWHYPLLAPDDSLDPRAIKKLSGAKKQFTSGDLLDFVRAHDDEFDSAELKKAFMDECGCEKSMFYKLKSFLESSKEIYQSKLTNKWGVRPQYNVI
jgi:hypothetical protein